MSSQPFPSSSNGPSSSSSLAPVSRKREPTISTVSVNSANSANNIPTTPNAILRSVGKDYAKALDKAVEDRNGLAAQNSQLWKLIEKQRSGYSSLMKELDRIRSERDSWKTKAKGAVRHNSSDNAHPMPSHDQTRPPQPHRKSSLPPLILTNRAISLATHPEVQESASPASTLTSSAGAMDTPVGYNSAMGATLHPSHSSHPSTSTITSASPSQLLPPFNQPLSRESRISLPPEVRQYIANMPESPNTATASNNNSSLGINNHSDSDGFLDMNDDSASATASSKAPSPDITDSDEEDLDPVMSYKPPRQPQDTQQARPDDFPLPPGSDNPDNHTSPVSALLPQQAQLIAAQQALVQQQRQEALAAQNRGQEEREAQIATQREQAIALQQSQAREAQAREAHVQMVAEQQKQQQKEREKQRAQAELEAQKRAVREAQADLEKARVRQEALDAERQRRGLASGPYIQNSPASAQASTSSMPLGSQRSPNPNSGSPPDLAPQRMPSTPTPAEIPVPATFRSLPLLQSDLQYTRVLVSHSFVRPNDRGKEVLSFVIQVDPSAAIPPQTPGPRKKPWKIQKLFSDVLGLDQRVRSSVTRNKSVMKKMANLPEGRLWNLKDAAPARVDQRKQVLKAYLQSLVDLPIKSNDEVIAFFTSDIVRGGGEAVTREGHKEGYLTKRGKNFGGWKTRYFVLDGPVLEYYESRGGAHLGSIQVTGAQIGRQQRAESGSDGHDEKEYRHAFLVVEAKKGQGGSHPRHVLCAESDAERDAWVDILVRYFTGSYGDDPTMNYASGSRDPLASVPSYTPSSASTTASSPSPNGRTSSSSSRPIVQKGNAIPIASLPPDSANPKLYDYAAAHAQQQGQQGQQGRRSPHLPSSLPTDSPLSASIAAGERSNSEMGHYIDADNRRHGRGASPEKLRRPPPVSVSTPQAPSPIVERPETPDRVKKPISAPMNGQPIPAGYKFGGEKDEKDSVKSGSEKNDPTKNADRREKAKSRGFWGFGARATEKPAAMPLFGRPVFGVTLEESLEVAQIAALPSVIFRCIQYLEAEKAETEEGIYRLSGSSAEIKTLKDRFNTEGDLDLLAGDQFWDPHAVAGLLKSFMRELPASILTRELHLRFLSVIDFVNAEERIHELSQLIAALPAANYTLLRALTAHLILIVKNAPINKMTMRNVGIVFSPTLGIPAGVFSLMLGEFTRVFNVDDGEAEGDDKDEAKQDENHAGQRNGADPTKLSVRSPRASSEGLDRRNSRHYNDAAADQLLGLTGRGQLSAPSDDEDDDDEAFSVAGTETTTDGELDSNHSRSPAPESQKFTPPDTPTAPKTKTPVNLSVHVSDRGHRHSRMLGLPSSPRPTQTSYPTPDDPD